MSTTTLIAIVIALFVIVSVIAIWRYRRNINLELDGPASTRLRLRGGNQREPGALAQDVISRSGRLNVHDETGQGAQAIRADVSGDIDVVSKDMITARPDPKASPRPRRGQRQP